MATATTIRFGDQSLLVEWVAASGTFTAPCGLTSLNKTTQVETATTNVPDCDDPDLASWLEIDEISRHMVLSGSGVAAQESQKLWDAWDRSGGYKNVRWFRDLLSANGGGYYVGAALLTQFEEVGSRGARWTHNIGLAFNGKPTWVPAA